MAVVSVVGPYRSGKSFLLYVLAKPLVFVLFPPPPPPSPNFIGRFRAEQQSADGPHQRFRARLNRAAGNDGRLVLGRSARCERHGFDSGQCPLFSAVCCTHLTHALLLACSGQLDTEGMYSPHVPAAYDAKMFALSLIFSSTLLYNELGVLSQQDVDRFQYLARLTVQFLDKTNVNATAPAGGAAAGAGASAAARLGAAGRDLTRPPALHELNRPAFFWVLEDFNLDLPVGQTPEQWLSEFLRSNRDGESAAAQTKKLFAGGELVSGSGGGSWNRGEGILSQLPYSLCS